MLGDSSRDDDSRFLAEFLCRVPQIYFKISMDLSVYSSWVIKSCFALNRKPKLPCRFGGMKLVLKANLTGLQTLNPEP